MLSFDHFNDTVLHHIEMCLITCLSQIVQFQKRMSLMPSQLALNKIADWVAVISCLHLFLLVKLWFHPCFFSFSCINFSKWKRLFTVIEFCQLEVKFHLCCLLCSYSNSLSLNILLLCVHFGMTKAHGIQNSTECVWEDHASFVINSWENHRKLLEDIWLYWRIKGVHWRANTAALTFRTKQYSTSNSRHICYGNRFYNDFFLNHNTIALVRNCLKLLSYVVTETALDGMKKNQLS